jgi:hypothetical protein
VIDRIIDFSVRNRFLVLLLVAAAALAGARSLRSVPLDALPDLGDTQVIVYSRWERSPDLVEAQVTYPIVTALLGAPGVRAVRGVSDFGYSFVYVIFEDGTDIYWARTRTWVPLRRAVAAAADSRAGPGCGRAQLGVRTRWWTSPASTAWPSCAPTRTGTSSTISRRCPGWPRSRPSAGSASSTR